MLEGMEGEDKRVRLVEDKLKLVGKVGEDRKLVVELRMGIVESKLNY